MQVFDDTPCILGEGPLWHPTRQALFWFDILGQRMMAKAPSGTRQDWAFDTYVSAAGWVDHDTLLVASATALLTFDIPTGTHSVVIPLEADNPNTRSNDGRADPQGGFWIGTMALDASPGAGAIYRYAKGELRPLFTDITVPNSICFSLDGTTAYFADTVDQRIMQVALDPDGWPADAPQVFVDLTEQGLNPDGAVIDSRGIMWNAQWDAGQLGLYARPGDRGTTLEVPAKRPTCPAFGGTTLYVTTASVGLGDAPGAGQTYALDIGIAGQPEHQVIL
ncbi:MAG: SMP-30/gluconolactonase/LRE family protein [Pseudomonadota bacterium]